MTEKAANSTQANGAIARKKTLSTLQGRLRVGTALAGMMLPLGMPGLALAADECGAPIGGVVNCSAAGNSYSSGIAYTGVTSLTLSPDAVVETSGSPAIGIIGSGGPGTLDIDLQGRVVSTGAMGTGVSVDTTPATTTVNVNSITSAGKGLRISGDTGSIDVTAGTIESGQGGIEVTSYDAAISIDAHSISSGDDAIYAVIGAGTGAVKVYSDGLLSTTGGNSMGVLASGYGDVDIDVNTVTTEGDYSDGLQADAAGPGGTVSVDAVSVSTKGEGSKAIYAASIDGKMDVNVRDASTEGDNATALRLTSGSGDINLVSTGALTTLGKDSVAINASSAGNIDIDVNTVKTSGNGTVGNGSHGIKAKAIGSGSTVTIDATSVETRGDNSTAILATTTDGAIDISVGGASTLGAASSAVQAESTSGPLTITNSGVITTRGNDSHGIAATSSNGTVSVTNDGTITTEGKDSVAIAATSSTKEVRVTNTGTLETHGESSEAISTWTTDGDIIIDNSGDVATTGPDSWAIRAESYTGDITIRGNGNVTTADGVAIRAQNNDTGNVFIDVGSVTAGGTRGNAISGTTFSGDIDVKVKKAAATGAGYAVDLRTSGGGDVTLRADTVTTLGGIGVFVIGSTGKVDLKVDTIDTQGTGVSVSNMTTGEVAIDVGSITTGGDLSHAISVWSDPPPVGLKNGRIAIDVHGPISTSGFYAKGITVETDGDVGIAAGTISTEGEESSAITANSHSGKLDVRVNGSITTKGDRAKAIDAQADNDINIRAGAISTEGEESSGIVANAGSGKLDVVVDGPIKTVGESAKGMELWGGGDVNVTAGDISTERDDGIGIDAGSTAGKVTIVSRGSIVTGGHYPRGENAHGLRADGATGVVVEANSISTSGKKADGIDVKGGGDGVKVKVRDVSATGRDSNGIVAYATAGSAELNVGNVYSESASAIDVAADDSHGNVAVEVSGKVSAGGGSTIYSRSAGGTSINILAGGEVSVANDTTTAILADGPNVVIDNAGRLSATTVPTVIAVNGVATLRNSGTFVGGVAFGAGDDIVANSGMFDLAGDSEFGVGDDRFTNTGTVSVLDSAKLANLERFENSGLVTMANNRAGDVLTISGSTPGIGDYIGTNGRFVLDINTAAADPSAMNDKLVIGGKASGTTVIALNSLRGGALLPGRTLTLVDAAGGSAAGAFTLAPETIDAGFARYFMNYDGSADDFYISASEGRGLFQMLNVSEGAQALWRQSADVWSARTMAQRDPAGEAHDRTPVWVQFYGSVEQRDQGFSASSGNFDISYRQRHAGGQVGVDLGEIGGVTYGVTGGYLASALKFAGTDDRTDYDAYSLGAYAQGEWDGFFVNALAKYDVLGAKIDSVTGGFTEKLDGKAYGLQVEAGARFGDSGLFIEPVASVAYSATDLETLAALGATVDFARSDSLLGKAGARIGGTADIGSGLATFYLGAHVVNEFEGKGSVRFDTGTLTTKLVDDAVGTYGQFQLGATLASKAGLTGFVEATATVGGDYQNYGGRLGLRLAF